MRPFEVWFREFQKTKGSALLLAPLSWAYLGGITLRHQLYDSKLLKQKVSTACVVSVGNLVAGGTGKTQVVDLIADELLKDLNVAILSRGYRSQSEKKKKALLVDPLKTPPELCGDEPWLLASRLSLAKVIVCKDRFLAAEEGEKLESQVLILDDGMQHRRLYRNFEIVVLDAKDPFCKKKYLPWGMLRDTPKRLRNVDLVVSIGRLSLEDKMELENLTEAPLVQANIRVTGVKALNGEESLSLEGKKVGVFCGIGNPERFVETVKSLGAQVVIHRFFKDHGAFRERDLLSFSFEAKEKGAEVLVCTEKDKVRLKKTKNLEKCPIGWIQAKLEIDENLFAFVGMMQQIKQLAGAV